MNFTLWVTTTCNLNCRYCYEGGNKLNLTMEKTTITRTIEFIKQSMVSSDESDFNINFHGGEPLLAIDIIYEFVTLLKKVMPYKQPHYYITSNGILLSKTILQFFKDNNFILSLSIDGEKSVHDGNRRTHDGHGTYECILPHIYMALEQMPLTCARMTIQSKNAHMLSSNIIHLIKMGFVNIDPVPDMYDSGWNTRTLNDFENELKSVATYIKNTNIEVSLITSVPRIPRRGSCSGGKTTFHIYSDGTIYPCAAVAGDITYSLGTVPTLVPERVAYWHRCDDNKVNSCIGCTRYDYCDATRCKIINEKIFGNMLLPPPLLCAFQNIMINAYMSYIKNSQM